MFSTIRKMDLLIAVYIFCIAASEFLGAKTFPLFQIGDMKFNGSVSIFLVVFIFTINDIVIEVFGKERAQSIIKTGLIVIFLILIYSLFAISLPPSSRFAASESAYDEVFARTARISAASLIAFASSLFLDVQVFARLRARLGDKSLWLRNNLSNFSAQLVDTVVFMVVAFYAINDSFSSNAAFLFSLILPYWILKCGISVIETPLVYAGVKWLRTEKETTANFTSETVSKSVSKNRNKPHHAKSK